MTLDDFIGKLWQHYIAIAPSAGRVRDLLEARGDTFVWLPEG